MNHNNFNFSYPPPNTFPITAPPPPPPPEPAPPSPPTWSNWGIQPGMVSPNMNFASIPPPMYTMPPQLPTNTNHQANVDKPFIRPQKFSSTNSINSRSPSFDRSQNNQSRYLASNVPTQNSYNTQRFKRPSLPNYESWRLNQLSQNKQHYPNRNDGNLNNDYQNNTRYQHQRAGKSTQDNYERPKKRKKPLSLALSVKIGWTEEEARLAFNMEKECNKNAKHQSLKIKFPDRELNRDIIAAFHPSIDNVYFQQPSNPRFCFVTLQEGTDADAVIDALNKTKFGEGYLQTEYKKDKEDELNVGPEDIDPLTLYVGNLAQEVTKEDMCKMFPSHKRIDIGYAKKMKYTRYAFVSFRNVSDSIEAFKKTHCSQMYSKSLIVRFRRLHGTVGMPGEPKIQISSAISSPGNRNINVSGDEFNSSGNKALDDIYFDGESMDNHKPLPYKMEPADGDYNSTESNSNNYQSNGINLHDKESNANDSNSDGSQSMPSSSENLPIDTSIVKTEPTDECEDVKPFITPFLPESDLLELLSKSRSNQPRPFIVKEEPNDEAPSELLTANEIKKEENPDIDFSDYQ